MHDQDVHTDRDPREPVVGYARLDDDAVADPDAEPVTGGTLADENAQTYKSAAHDENREPLADDAERNDLTYTGEVTDQSDTHDTEIHDTETHDTETHDDDAVDAAETAPAVATQTDDNPWNDAARPDDTLSTDTAQPDDTLSTDTAQPDDTLSTDTAQPDVTPSNDTAQPDVTPSNDALKPGAADTTPFGKLWADADVTGLRERWHVLQLGFIDDPQHVATEAESLVTEAVDALTATLNARKDELADWRSGDAGTEDTERLRAAVRRYRDLFDQLLQL